MNKIAEFSRQFGLGTIADQLGVEFTPHRAVDDAYATMKIAEAMCKEEGVGFLELIEKYQIDLGKIENYEVTQNSSVAQREYFAEAARRKEEREQQRIKFHHFIDREKRKRAKEGKLKGKKVCFSHPVELIGEQAENLAAAAFGAGAFITYRAEECDLYVRLETETGARLLSAQKRNARLFSPEEFLEFLAK